MIRKIYFILLSSLITVLAQAQVVKDITVSGKAPFTDHVSLKSDSKDMDIIVKFVFDEPNEALTVSLISYRSLFVFREDVRYKQVKGFWSSKLKVDKFPYVVAAEKDQKFKLSSTMKMAIPKPRREYIFHRWINYDGLIPQPTEYKMVNDVIEQKFDIKNKQNNVSVSLRDIFLMEVDAKNINTYWMVYGKDLNTKYQITLQRDPCFGKEQEIQEVQKLLADIQKAFKPFQTKYKSGTVATQDQHKLFEDTKNALTQQFPQRSVETECADLQQQWDMYNAYVDSIATMDCKVVEPVVETVKGAKKVRITDPNVTLLLSKAHRIDDMVAQWIYSDDQTECSNLSQSCRKLINEGNTIIEENKMITQEQLNAVKLFRKAEKHFKVVCGY